MENVVLHTQYTVRTSMKNSRLPNIIDFFLLKKLCLQIKKGKKQMLLAPISWSSSPLFCRYLAEVPYGMIDDKTLVNIPLI